MISAASYVFSRAPKGPFLLPLRNLFPTAGPLFREACRGFWSGRSLETPMSAARDGPLQNDGPFPAMPVSPLL